MTIRPSIAILRLSKVELILTIRVLNLSTSYKSTVDKEGMRP